MARWEERRCGAEDWREGMKCFRDELTDGDGAMEVEEQKVGKL